jgi:hypothetical protein
VCGFAPSAAGSQNARHANPVVEGVEPVAAPRQAHNTAVHLHNGLTDTKLRMLQARRRQATPQNASGLARRHAPQCVRLRKAVRTMAKSMVHMAPLPKQWIPYIHFCALPHHLEPTSSWVRELFVPAPVAPAPADPHGNRAGVSRFYFGCFQNATGSSLGPCKVPELRIELPATLEHA